MFIDMKNEKIIGATTQSYLLEKSRVIQQSKDERNFHIFYSLMSSGNSKLLENLDLKNPKSPKVDIAFFKLLS